MHMTKYSPIEWTHDTFNPWQGCTKVGPECAHCYAETYDNRRLHTRETHWGRDALRLFHDDNYWRKPEKLNREATRTGQRLRVFCASLADVFENRTDVIPHRERLWQLIEATPMLDWLLLTKRPQNIRAMIPPTWLDQPRHNVWLGTSVGVRDRLHVIDDLRSVPAVVRFLSIEPLLEDLGQIDLNAINWVIVGGESGKKEDVRSMEARWVRAIRDRCVKRGVPFFFKQWGEYTGNNPDPHDPTAKENGGKAKGGRMLDGRKWDEFPRLTIE